MPPLPSTSGCRAEANGFDGIESRWKCVPGSELPENDRKGSNRLIVPATGVTKLLYDDSPATSRIEPFLVSDDVESPVGVEVAAEV